MSWETAVIGTVLFDPQSMVEAETLLPSDFSGPNQAVWAEILNLHRNNSLDLRTLSMIVEENRIIPTPETFIAQALTDRVGNVSEAVRRVEEAAVRKSVKKNAALIAAEAENDARETEELLDFAEKRIMSIRRDKQEGQTLQDIISIFMPRIEGTLTGDFHPAWQPSIKALQSLIKYAEDTDMIIVAGRPGEGKSSLCRYEAFQVVAERDSEGRVIGPGKPVTIFNYDNDPMDYARWFISMMADIDASKMKDMRMMTRPEQERMRQAAQILARLPLTIESSRGDGQWMYRTMRRHVAEKKTSLGILDYAQQVFNGKEKKNDDVSITSQYVRKINGELKIPMLVAAQLNREYERRGREGGPKLSDLRDSGSLEQDATIVVFPVNVWSDPTEANFRQYPENVDQRTNRVYPRPKAVPVQFDVAKNRNGETGRSAVVKWVKSTNRYVAGV